MAEYVFWAVIILDYTIIFKSLEDVNLVLIVNTSICKVMKKASKKI